MCRRLTPLKFGRRPSEWPIQIITTAAARQLFASKKPPNGPAGTHLDRQVVAVSDLEIKRDIVRHVQEDTARVVVDSERKRLVRIFDQRVTGSTVCSEIRICG